MIVRFKQILQRLRDALIDKDRDKDFFPVYEMCRPYTMTSIERMYALYQAVKYVVQNRIEGDFVECGVWKGGSSMLIAATLNQLKCYDRKIYLYDTFEGMSEPSEKDKNYADVEAKKLLVDRRAERRKDGKTERRKDGKTERRKEKSLIWAYSTLEQVKQNFSTISYPEENIFYVKGKVEDTISANSHQKISLLRLDTDWYESTYHELIYLYPALQRNGVLIIDDYGHWQGAREAVDKYFKENSINLLLNRIDYTGRSAIKI